MDSLQHLDAAVLTAYLLACLCIGLYKASKVKTLKAFALGSVSLASPVLVMTIFASAFGAGSIIGYSGQMYKYGTLYVLCLLLQPIFWLVTSWIFTKNI